MNSLRSERGAVAPLVLTVVALLSAVLVVVPYFILGQTVPPNYIGLRRNYFTIPLVLEKGFEEEGLVPGRHYQIPGLTTVFLLPRNFLFVNLNEGREGGDLDKPELLIPTTDGSKVKTDVSLILRLYEGPEYVEEPATPVAQAGDGEAAPIPVHKKRAHGGPLNLVSVFPIDTLSQLESFAQIAESELRSALSALSTSDYYNPVLRERATLEAAEAINSKVAPNGIELWSALVRRYVYADPSIDNQIF